MVCGFRGKVFVLLGLGVGACTGSEHTPSQTSDGQNAISSGTDGSPGPTATSTGVTGSETSSSAGGAGTGGSATSSSTANTATSAAGGSGPQTSAGGIAATATTAGAGGEANADCMSFSSEPLDPAFSAWDLLINGSGFDDYDGQRIRLVIYTDGAWRAVAEQDVVQGGFRFAVPGAASDYSNFGLYVDRDDDDRCDDDEPVWSFTTGAGGCHRLPCPPEDGVVIENIQLPLEDCQDCGPWVPHPLTSIGVTDQCMTGAGTDLAERLACPLER